jgi:hypothetical protein
MDAANAAMAMMNTWETLVLVSLVYLLVFLAHRAA